VLRCPCLLRLGPDFVGRSAEGQRCAAERPVNGREPASPGCDDITIGKPTDRAGGRAARRQNAASIAHAEGTGAPAREHDMASSRAASNAPKIVRCMSAAELAQLSVAGTRNRVGTDKLMAAAFPTRSAPNARVHPIRQTTIPAPASGAGSPPPCSSAPMTAKAPGSLMLFRWSRFSRRNAGRARCGTRRYGR
jgi:hypothetical protein